MCDFYIYLTFLKMLHKASLKRMTEAVMFESGMDTRTSDVKTIKIERAASTMVTLQT